MASTQEQLQGSVGWGHALPGHQALVDTLLVAVHEPHAPAVHAGDVAQAGPEGREA
jgi:hypothetical protein